MIEFVGILEGEGSTWGVRFPDLPGCVGGGSSPEEAITDAAVALRDVIAHKRAGGFSMPVPSTAEAIAARGKVGPGERVVVVSPAA